MLRDSLSGLGTKIDKAFLTKTLRLGLFNEHLQGYAELVHCTSPLVHCVIFHTPYRAEVNHLKLKSEHLVNEFYNHARIVKKNNSIV